MAFMHSLDSERHAGDVEVTGKLVPLKKPNERAILFDDGSGVQTWLPKSRITLEDNGDGTVTVYMPRWLAREKRYF